jgi:hypothetical protein
MNADRATMSFISQVQAGSSDFCYTAAAARPSSNPTAKQYSIPA